MNKHTGLVFFSLLILIVGLIMSLPSGNPFATTRQTNLPEKLADLSDLAQLTPAEIQALEAGQPVSKLLNSNAKHEVAVLGAVWINAPVSKYVQAMKDIEPLEHGDGFLVSKRISDPPRLADFAALKLPAVDIEDLKKCRVDDCDVKLDENAIKRIQKEVDWSKPTAVKDVNEIMRQVALGFVTSYQQNGNQGLPVYRDNDEPTDVAK